MKEKKKCGDESFPQGSSISTCSYKEGQGKKVCKVSRDLQKIASQCSFFGSSRANNRICQIYKELLTKKRFIEQDTSQLSA